MIHGMSRSSGPAIDEPSIGNQIGPYRLLRLLGGRANGLIYEVEKLPGGERAAMRVLPAGRAAAFGAVERMFSDIRSLSQLGNPHLVAVTDLIDAEQSGGVSAIIMELLEGRSLARVLASERTLPTARVLDILGQVLDGLRAIHQVKLVHRDLKPEHIFLTRSPERQEHVKLLGFGMGRAVTAQRDSEDAWGADEDTSISTPAYLAPEQAFGKEPDHRTDIYAFGVILYQLLCGRLPYGGRNLSELLVELETDSPPPAPRQILSDPLGRTLDAIARRCLEKDPARRWASADELKSIFDGLRSGNASAAAVLEEIGDTAPKPKLRPGWMVAAAVTVALATAGGVLVCRRQDGPGVAEQQVAPVAPLRPQAAGPQNGGPGSPPR
jgi:serine/threonine protein kinase